MISPSVVPPEGLDLWKSDEFHLGGASASSASAQDMGRRLPLFQREAVFVALRRPLTSSPHTHPPTEFFVRGVGGTENACSLLLTFLDIDSLHPLPLEQQGCVKCQEELCSWAPWPQFLCGLHFLLSAFCSSDGNQRMQLEDNLLVPNLIWGPLLA